MRQLHYVLCQGQLQEGAEGVAVNVPLSFRQHRKLISAVKKALNRKGWKVRDLADAAGYSPRTVYRLFNPRIPASRDCVYEITRVLEINLEDIS